MQVRDPLACGVMEEGTRLVLVRHGESLAQELGIVGGHEGCRGLSARGRRQVEALRNRWVETGEVDDPVVCASVMPRALETAAILAPALGVPEAEIIRDCGLCEHHPGEGDGLLREEYDARYPFPETGWSPDLRRCPGDETWNEMAERVATTFDHLAGRQPGRTVVVATHGGWIVQVMIRLLGIDPGRDGMRAWLGCSNGSITEWRRVAKRYQQSATVWELTRYNDTAHLAGLP
jgi:broad specificity phosphatase PhoE